MPIIKGLRDLLAGGPYYVRLRRDRISVRDARNGRYFDDEPIAALGPGDPPTIEAIGSASRVSSGRVVNPFAHPRVLVDDFTIAEKVITYAIKAVSDGQLLAPSPIVVVHVTEELEGGLAPMEYRVLRELFESAGARETFFWEGRELTDDELKSGAYRGSAV